MLFSTYRLSMSRIIALIISLALSGMLYAAEPTSEAKIMVVNFELRDVSPLPNTAQEIERTEHIDTIIRNTLQEAGYTLIQPCEELIAVSQPGMGYLFDRPEVAGRIVLE